MALIYVTGAPGSGKSTIEDRLRSRGYQTYDMDDPSLGGAYDLETGRLVPVPAANERDAQWFKNHEWRASRPAVQELQRRGETETIFLCGVTANDAELLPLFDAVVFLDINEAELRGRILSRTDNDYGKNDFEMDDIMKRRQHIETLYSNTNTIHVDATQDPEALADDIVARVSSI